MTRTTTVAPCLRLRTLARGDHGPVVEVFDAMSPQSRHQRFLTPMPRLPRAIRDGLADVDGEVHVAVVAELVCPEPVAIGIGRYYRTTESAAELGLEVVDEWHGHGVGGRILRWLVSSAASAGVAEIHGAMLAENTRILTLLRSQLEITTGFEAPGVTWFRAPLPSHPSQEALVA